MYRTKAAEKKVRTKKVLGEPLTEDDEEDTEEENARHGLATKQPEDEKQEDLFRKGATPFCSHLNFAVRPHKAI